MTALDPWDIQQWQPQISRITGNVPGISREGSSKSLGYLGMALG